MKAIKFVGAWTLNVVLWPVQISLKAVMVAADWIYARTVRAWINVSAFRDRLVGRGCQ